MEKIYIISFIETINDNAEVETMLFNDLESAQDEMKTRFAQYKDMIRQNEDKDNYDITSNEISYLIEDYDGVVEFKCIIETPQEFAERLNIKIEEGHTKEEWESKYGENQDLWDFDLGELQDNSIEPNTEITYWLIEDRLYETEC